MIWSFLFYLENFVSLSTIYPFHFVLIKKKKFWDYWSSQKKQATLILIFKYHCYTAFLSKRCVDSWQGCLSASSWCEMLRSCLWGRWFYSLSLCLALTSVWAHMEASDHTLPVLGRTKQPHFSVSPISLLTQRKL